jgi:cellulose synthase (UDP-forming)
LGSIVKAETLPVEFRHTSVKGDQIAYGLEFKDIQPKEYFVLADLMYADSDALPKFLMSRRKHKNVFAGTLRFMWWGFSEPARAVAYAFKRPEKQSEPPAAEAIPEAPTIWLRRLISIANANPQSKVTMKTAEAPTKVA